MLILGSGTSHGVPMIGCRCPVCLSDDPRNKRFRPSVAVQHAGRTLLVDTTPELRMQALAFGLDRVDAVLYTHTHADHVFGLDDLRRFNDLSREEIPVYGDEATLEDIRRIFRYVFEPTQAGGGKPRIQLRRVEPEFELFGIPIQAFHVLHGSLPVLAYRFGRFAYVTDVNRIPATAMDRLRGLDLLVLDAVRFEPHSTHFGLWEAVEVARELSPRRTLFTHLSHRFDHAAVNSMLPDGMELAWDGLSLDVPL